VSEEIIESTNLQETIAHVDKQKAKKESDEFKKRIMDEDRCDRSIHGASTSFTRGYSRKYSSNYDNIDWSK
jgi:hypothetical protein